METIKKTEELLGRPVKFAGDCIGEEAYKMSVALKPGEVLILENLIDQYLKAVVAHDPSKLPLSKDVMYTENNQALEVGDGFWKTAQGLGNYRHVFADPEFGQVAMMGTMMEAGAPLLMSLRLRVELGRITEIE